MSTLPLRLAPICLLLLAMAAHAADDVLTLTDFETDADKKYEAQAGATIVAENARSGKKALKIANSGKEYVGIAFDGATLKEFSKQPMFCMDIFNPQDRAISFSVRADDAKSKDYGSRYNDDGYSARPGWSTVRINLSGLTRSSSGNFNEREALDMSKLTVFTIFTCPQEKAFTLYFDHARLEGTGLPTVEGLQAFDFGPKTSGVFPGFTGVNETSTYTAERGFGGVGIGRARRVANPDDLGGDYIQCTKFVVDVKGGPGAYIVELGLDRFGEWATPQLPRDRKVEINGKAVFSEKMNGAEFMKQRYLRFEDDEETPAFNLWDKRVKPSTPNRSFETEAANGKIEITLTDGNEPGEICYAVIYPKTKEKEGKAFMAALEKRRKDLFDGENSLALPKPPAEKFTPTAEETARGFAVFTRSSDEDINCNAVPRDGERNAAVDLIAAQGERRHAQIGLKAVKDVSGVKVTAADLAGPNGAKIPAASITLRKVRNFAKRYGNNRTATLTPFILQPLEALNLSPDLARGVWVSIAVPADAAPGAYTGSIAIQAGAASAKVPVKVNVLPFKLDAIDDVTVSCTGTTPGHWAGWYKDLDERFWTAADAVLRNQAEKGLNAVTGGPGMNLRGIKDGKADIDFTNTDRWFELANKYGLTHLGDSYQGLDVNLGFYKSFNKDGAAQNEANSQSRYNIPFGELLKIVYGTIEAHAKEKNWPPRSYYFLDEPRPDYGNIESAKALIELHLKYAPGVKFSGFYSPGEGRDPYFKLMPISIAHHTEQSIKDCVDAGKLAWTYSGGGARYDIGRWFFFAHQKGLSGFLRNGYQYVNSDPYYDFSDTEGSWAQVYPSKSGIADTTGWERTADGVNDYRYLKTLKARIDAAKKAGKLKAESDAAESFLTETLKPINLDHEESAALSPAEFAIFREKLARHISALSK